MPKDKDKKKKYNLRKSTQKKKKYKKNQDSDSDNSDSDWTPGCDEDFDLLEYQKFIQKVFPSKSGKERVKQLNKIDKLVKKQQKKKKLKKKKESDSSETEYEISESEEDDEDIVIKKKKKKKKKKHKTEEEEIYDEDEYDYEYDYEYEEDVEELKNALGENQKFNIIFTIGNPNTIGEDDSEFMDFEEYQEKMLKDEEKNEIISKDNKKEEKEEKEIEPDDRLFEKNQRVWLKTPKMKKKKSGTIKKSYNKKNNYDVKCDDEEIGLVRKYKS